MRKVDVSHHIGFMLPEDAIEKLIILGEEGKTSSVREIRNIFKEFKHYDYTIDITFYAENDVGEPPESILFIVEGGKDEPK
jgi:hypothetical protein